MEKSFTEASVSASRSVKTMNDELSEIWAELEQLAEELKPKSVDKEFIVQFCKKYRDEGYTWPAIAQLYNHVAEKRGWRGLNRKTLNEYYLAGANNGSND